MGRRSGPGAVRGCGEPGAPQAPQLTNAGAVGSMLAATDTWTATDKSAHHRRFSAKFSADCSA